MIQAGTQPVMCAGHRRPGLQDQVKIPELPGSARRTLPPAIFAAKSEPTQQPTQAAFSRAEILDPEFKVVQSGQAQPQSAERTKMQPESGQ